nr:hypothetical protein 3 [bacterium]
MNARLQAESPLCINGFFLAPWAITSIGPVRRISGYGDSPGLWYFDVNTTEMVADVDSDGNSNGSVTEQYGPGPFKTEEEANRVRDQLIQAVSDYATEQTKAGKMRAAIMRTQIIMEAMKLENSARLDADQAVAYGPEAFGRLAQEFEGQIQQVERGESWPVM